MPLGRNAFPKGVTLLSPIAKCATSEVHSSDGTPLMCAVQYGAGLFTHDRRSAPPMQLHVIYMAPQLHGATIAWRHIRHKPDLRPRKRLSTNFFLEPTERVSWMSAGRPGQRPSTPRFSSRGNEGRRRLDYCSAGSLMAYRWRRQGAAVVAGRAGTDKETG